ncbi:MAG: glycosyltransferase family 4 protein [Oligoflexia bacterium]|nr:glycosyltransferase family 4 protein [Oligoflexia bacterium]
MKILICCTSVSWGGLEQVAFRDALVLQSKGMDVHILGIGDSPLMESCVRNRIRFHKVLCEGKYVNPCLIVQMRLLCVKHKYDVVHIHCFNTIFPLLVALMGLDIPVAATRHIYVEHNKKDFFHRWYLNRINRVFAISDFARKNILDTYPFTPEKVESLYIGIDLKKYVRSREKGREFRLKYNIPEDRKIVGIIGRIDNMKGQMEFVEAARIITADKNDVHFLVVGRPTSDEYENYFELLKLKIHEYNLASRFTFTGFCEDVSMPLSAMDVFVAPSYFEAFGLTAIEAMACKVPVIMTNRGSIDEIIPDPGYGLRIEPRSSNEIADAVNLLLNDEKQARDMAARSFGRVSGIFSQEIYFSGLLRHYQDLIKKA